MSKIITYKVPNLIVVGIPFTWGKGLTWAIKVESGDMYFLETGTRVRATEEEIFANRILYAERIEIK
ncbi:hypothetical protein [Klebsiella phage VLC1]|uniref:Uncharacterized protein n=1 Tax=Klebsiella phage VLC1 TaxID=2686204 RepID=A0A6B9I9F9_9CAUD|nr:hypothetical protein [Klebsiella phage VLC1]QGZ00782.1 hypothetical protein [Klebsiella phage VLC2]